MVTTAFYVFRNELNILRTDISPFIILFIMPGLALLLLTPALGAIAREQGNNLASTGIELSVPAMSVMFGSLGAAFLCFAIVREYEWQSWPRLLVSPVNSVGLLLGKLLLPSFLVFAQQLLLLFLALGLWGGSDTVQFTAYLYFSILFALNISAFGLAIAASFASMQKMNALIHVGALIFAASSGAFIPLTQLPHGLAEFAYLTPSYWLVQHQSAAIAGELSVNQALQCSAVLILQSVLLLVYTVSRLRHFRVK